MSAFDPYAPMSWRLSAFCRWACQKADQPHLFDPNMSRGEARELLRRLGVVRVSST